jgi:hypothetical protein
MGLPCSEAAVERSVSLGCGCGAVATFAGCRLPADDFPGPFLLLRESAWQVTSCAAAHANPVCQCYVPGERRGREWLIRIVGRKYVVL